MIFSGLPARIALLAFVPVLGLAALASAWLGYERYQAGVQEINTRGTTLVRQAALALEGDRLVWRGQQPLGIVRDTLRFGPMKPVGLTDPRTGRRPHAVIQLRQEDAGIAQTQCRKLQCHRWNCRRFRTVQLHRITSQLSRYIYMQQQMNSCVFSSSL